MCYEQSMLIICFYAKIWHVPLCDNDRMFCDFRVEAHRRYSVQ